MTVTTERVWFIPRPQPEPSALDRAVDVLRSARRPLVIAGGGVRRPGDQKLYL
jgi:3D-(3,5/4)-trihydroxycyclohexane-1,2-dione acylhydrolase (decyclizing)